MSVLDPKVGISKVNIYCKCIRVWINSKCLQFLKSFKKEHDKSTKNRQNFSQFHLDYIVFAMALFLKKIFTYMETITNKYIQMIIKV